MGMSTFAQQIADTVSVAVMVASPLLAIGLAQVYRDVAEANREADQQLERLKAELDMETERQKQIKLEIEKTQARLDRIVARLTIN